MPTHNVDGQAIVPLTEEQKYLFDARGWLLIPGVLSEAEVEEMRAYALHLLDDPDSLTEHERSFAAPTSPTTCRATSITDKIWATASWPAEWFAENRLHRSSTLPLL